MSGECRTTVSFVGYDGRSENAVYEWREGFVQSDPGRSSSRPKLTMVEERDRAKLIHGLERWLDERR